MDDKTLHIQTDFIQQDGKDTFYNHRYEPTPYDVLDNLFSVFTPEPDSCLVDYGCGPGRLNFYVEKRFGLSSIGVEYAREFYEKALDNLASYKGRKDRITFCHCKAQDYIVPSCAGYFYFFNPFSVEIFRQVIGRILDSWEENPRPLTLVLYYPEDDAIFYLEQHTLFRLVDEIAASDAVCHDRRERFCLYHLE